MRRASLPKSPSSSQGGQSVNEYCLIMKYIIHIISIVVAFVLLFSAYGGRVDPNIWSLPSLATLALPVIAIVVLVLLALLLIFRQWRSAVVLVAALFLSWPTLRLISPVNLFHPDVDSAKTQLKVLTMNVTQFNWTEGDDPSQSMRYILDQNADIVVIQEGLVDFSYEQLKTVQPMLDELYQKYPYRKEAFFDVGILSKYPYTDVKSPALAADSISYFIKAWDVQAPGGDLRVVSMHLSSLRFTVNDSKILDSMNVPSDRKSRVKSVVRKLDYGFRTHVRQVQAMRNLLDETVGDVLVMGDMNDTPGSFAYRTLCGDDLLDAWAEAGCGPTYTFNAHHLYVKIDHILYRGDLELLTCRRDKKGDSDHYPLVAIFQR